MAPTGPTGDATGPNTVGLQQQPQTSSTTPVTEPSSTGSPTANWRSAFNSPTEVTILSSQPLALNQMPLSPAGQAVSQSQTAIFLLEVSDGNFKFLLQSYTPYPPGTQLTLHHVQGDQITILNQNNSANLPLNHLQRHLAELGDKVLPIPQLAHNLKQTVAAITTSLELNLKAHQNLAKPLAEFTKQAEQLGVILEQLTLGSNQLGVNEVRNKIRDSGLYFESKLSKLASISSAKTPNGSTPVTHQAQPAAALRYDQKRALSQLLWATIELYKQLEPTNSGKAVAAYTPLKVLSEPSQVLSELDTSLMTKPLNSGSTHIQRRFETMLQSLLLNTQLSGTPQSCDPAHQTLTNMYGLAALLNFLSQLTHTPQTNVSAALLDTGWGTLFNLLFGVPGILTKAKPAQTDKNASRALQDLIGQIQGQLTRLTAKQLVLLSQQERLNEKQPVTQIELFLAFGEQIMQVPLTIWQYKRSRQAARPQAEQSWQIELGFDLGPLGLMRTIARYTTGSLDLTFQLQHAETQQLIAREIKKLQAPLLRWGITLNRIGYQPFRPSHLQAPAEAQGTFQFVNIQL